MSQNRLTLFELLRWPIDICALELAFGYGVGKASQMYFASTPIPISILLFLVWFVSLSSTYLVCRYLPSNEALDCFGRNSFTIVWINIALVLATGVPILSVLYWNGLFFWALSLFVGAAKTIHSLESSRRKEMGQMPIYSRIEYHPLGKGFLVHFIFSPSPDAFALRPFPTALCFSTASLGISILLAFGRTHESLGTYLLGIPLCAYIIVSGMSRAHALKHGRSA